MLLKFTNSSDRSTFNNGKGKAAKGNTISIVLQVKLVKFVRETKRYQQAYWNKSIKRKSSQLLCVCLLLSFCLALTISHLSRASVSELLYKRLMLLR